MSVYRKFIDSAAGQPGQLPARNHVKFALDSPEPGPALARQKSRAQMSARLSPLASIVGSTISSTPISKHNYKRLVETGGDGASYAAFQPEPMHHHHPQHHQHLERQHHPPQQNLYTTTVHVHQRQASMGAHHHQARAHLAPVAPPGQLGREQHQSARCLSLADLQGQPRSGSAASSRALSVHELAMHQIHRRTQSRVYATAAAQPHHKRSVFHTDDPVLLKWMQAMRFETELECLTALQARTLAIDEHSAGALSVRNSQVAIQEMRLESELILGLIDCLIDSLPVNFNTIEKFAMDFSELYVKLLEMTRAQTSAAKAAAVAVASQARNAPNSHTYCNRLNNNSLTIINCTPRKSLASARTLKPLDKLAVQIREICIEMAQLIQSHQENYNSYEHIDNALFEAMLRKIKEFLGKFVEISIRTECANIVRALERFDFTRDSSAAALARSVCSSASLRPVRPYESSAAQLPLKWALIALWQLTKDDAYICRTLTEKWQTVPASESSCPGTPTATSCTPHGEQHATGACEQLMRPRSAKRLDYSTKYDENNNNTNSENLRPQVQPLRVATGQTDHSLRSDYEKLYQICQNDEHFREKQDQLMRQRAATTTGASGQQQAGGALSSALKSKQPLKQVSTIELLIDIIINQPNKHERVDMVKFLHESKLVDVEDLDQSISAAFYTSNQYKVAALRILNHLCTNDQAVKTILKCFSTPPPRRGHPLPENKIIKSIFECYQTAQEHIYQNETMLHSLVNRTPSRRMRKRARHQTDTAESDEFTSDYGSRHTTTNTNSAPASTSELGLGGPPCMDAGGLGQNYAEGGGGDEEGDDAVVKEAIRLLVQLTTPFYKSAQGQDYYTLIGRFSIESLVRYLTNIIKCTQNREMLLLSLSALANISFITTEPMKLAGTNAIVLDMFRSSRARSKDLELRDQTVTILANTVDKNLLDVVSNGGLTFLLSSLEICPTRMSNYRIPRRQEEEEERHHEVDPYSNIDSATDSETCYGSLGGATSTSSTGARRRNLHLDNMPRDRKPIDLSDEFLDDLDCACDNQQSMPVLQLTCLSRLTVNEMAALERIHQKTAVAFARMSADPSTSRMVLKYGGIKQMIDLCKLSHKRNHSDTVLIACLAALRKMSKVIGRDTFRHYNALDLIELEPDRALEIYGRLYASEV